MLSLISLSLIQWVKFATRSEEMAAVVKVVFVSQFFNTGIIILILNMNFGEHEPREFWGLFNGRYTDYSPRWYKDVGAQIYQTYFVQMLMPYINLLIEYLLLKLGHCLDGGCGCDKRKTKCKNLHQFKDAYTGADFAIDLSYLYADSLNVIFLAMFYGIGMPIMFPMAAVILASQRLCQRLRVAYLCRLPPFLGNELSQAVYAVMKWAPLFMLYNAYWLMGNRQTFTNRYSYISKVYHPMRSGHYFTDFKLNQAMPLGYPLVFVTTVVAIQKLVPEEVLMRLGYGMYRQMVSIREDLPTFKDALPGEYLDRLQIQQAYVYESYGYNVIQQTLLDSLQGGKAGSRKIVNIPWYNVQYVPAYASDFAFIGPHVQGRSEFISDGDAIDANNRFQSDVVTLFLNLSALPDEVAAAIEISDEDYSTNLRAELAKYYKKHPMKSFGQSSMDTWVRLYMEFLSEKESADDAARIAEQARAVKRKQEEEARQ